MITDRFIHIGLGDTGEGVIRYAIDRRLLKKKRISPVLEDAHIILRVARERSAAPAFSFVRNPWDWYISRWIHALKTRRWRGTFRSMMLDARQASFSDEWRMMTEPGVDYVGHFEHLPRDLARILAAIMPEVIKESEVLGWFPEVWQQWGGRPWCECIEQWMREELYTPELRRLVAYRDAEIIEKWGYRYEDRYHM